MLVYRLATIVILFGLCRANPVSENDKKEVTSQEWRQAWEKLAALEKNALGKSQFPEPADTGCQCIKYNCGCCVKLDISKIHLDTTACVNVSYLPDQYGFSLTFSLGKKVYINETVSAKNPPPICVGIPEFEKQASVCLVFYDLDYTKSEFTGCLKLEARLLHVKVEDVDIGCFDFPLLTENLTNRPLPMLIKGRKLPISMAGKADVKMQEYQRL